jgi:hypothetical protein
MYFKMTKISDNANNLRASSVEGFGHNMPEVGKRFTLLAAPLTEGAEFRMIKTSVVQYLTYNFMTVWITTENSKYEIELLPEDSQ